MNKKVNLKQLIDDITISNNTYRDINKTPLNRILAMWDLGDILFKNGVDKPHTCGWEIQDHTVGVIKRMTIARSHRIRKIWPSKDNFKILFKDIKGISILIESLPLLDKDGPAHNILSKNIKGDLIKNMNTLSTIEFKKYIKELKAKYKIGRIGEENDRKKYLNDYTEIKEKFGEIYNFLKENILADKFDAIINFKNEVSLEQRKVFANLCLSISSKNNIIYYKPAELNNISEFFNFDFVFNSLKNLLNEKNDIERARIRRVILPEEFIEMIDILNSIVDEEKISNYQKRIKNKITIL